MTNLDKRKIIANVELIIRKGILEEIQSDNIAENVFRAQFLPLLRTYEIMVGNLKAKLNNKSHPNLEI